MRRPYCGLDTCKTRGVTHWNARVSGPDRLLLCRFPGRRLLSDLSQDVDANLRAAREQVLRQIRFRKLDSELAFKKAVQLHVAERIHHAFAEKICVFRERIIEESRRKYCKPAGEVQKWIRHRNNRWRQPFRSLASGLSGRPDGRVEELIYDEFGT